MATCPYRINRKKGNGTYEFVDEFGFCLESFCPCFRELEYKEPPMVVKECLRDGSFLRLEVIHKEQKLSKEEVEERSNVVAEHLKKKDYGRL